MANPEEIVFRSQLSEGNTTRLQHVLARAQRGESVAVAVIGGSITQGAKVGTPEHRYANRVAAWWRGTFPQATVKLVNTR